MIVEIHSNNASGLVNLLLITNDSSKINSKYFAFPGASSGVIDLLKFSMM